VQVGNWDISLPTNEVVTLTYKSESTAPGCGSAVSAVNTWLYYNQNQTTNTFASFSVHFVFGTSLGSHDGYSSTNVEVVQTKNYTQNFVTMFYTLSPS